MAYIHAAARPVFTVAIEVDRYMIDTHAGTRSRSRLGSTTTTGTEGRHRTPPLSDFSTSTTVDSCSATIGLEWYALLALWLWTFCMKAPSTYFSFHARAVFLVLSHHGVTYFQWSKVLSTTIWGSTQ